MPCEKKKAPPRRKLPLCTPPTRRLLQSRTIHDVPQGAMFCFPSSLSPSPSVSRMCICEKETCCPPTCCHLANNQDAIRNGQQPEREKSIESVEIKDGVASEGFPCCQDILRKLAQKIMAFSDTQLDKRVCVRDNKSEETPPCCVSSKPVTSLPECSTKTCPISKSSQKVNTSSKKDSCCNIPECQDTELFEEPSKPIRGNQEKPVVPKEELCSVTSCAQDFSPQSAKWTNSDSEASSTQLDKQSDYASNGTPKLRAMPHPAPAVQSRKESINIGKNSSMKLIGGKNEEPKQKKSCFKLFRRSSENKVNGKKDTLTKKEETCNNKNCKTKTCTCRFPPAYNEYYDCTGQISGLCNCENENSQNDNNV